jgi:hypothetical protein
MADVPLPLGSRTIPGLSFQLLTGTAHNDWTSTALTERLTQSLTNQLSSLTWLRSTDFLQIPPDILSFLRCSCRLAPWSFIPLLHSNLFRHLLLTIGPLWPCPLCRAGTARRVICLSAAANLFQRPVARCRSPYRSSSSLMVSTTASFLGT